MDKIIPIVLDAITFEIQNFKYNSSELKYYLDEFDVPTNNKTTEIIYEAARCIVEPQIKNQEAEDWYIDFQESDKDNWIGFIKNNFGETWGRIADIVREFGY